MKLAPIRSALDGGVPAALATCSADGTPNVTSVWQVHYVDDEHVALAFQFFNKTRDNLAQNPEASVLFIDPITGGRYRLGLRFDHTVTDGALFQSMRAKVAGVASHTGMGGVFELRGADIFQVLDVERVTGPSLAPVPVQSNRLAATREMVRRLAGVADLSQALDTTLDGLGELFGMRHALLLCVDETGQWLYTVASRGYEESGVGSEVMIGEGIIGTAAQYRTPVRLSCLSADYSYGRAMRAQAVKDGLIAVDTGIPFPGLAEPQSQLAVPIAAGDWLAGVLYVESGEQRRFDFEDEDALAIVAAQLGLAMRLLIQPADAAPAPQETAPQPKAPASGQPILIRYFATTQSVFLDDDYLIKGVAGAVLWLLLNDYQQAGRTDFTNRELRLDGRLRLPEIDDNLETRLILLQRRLGERCQWLGFEKIGRGRFRLRVDRPVKLHDVEHDAAAGREAA
ncbi:MAG: GAF domain-containing protein [Burkholderiales bacterium]|nr:GAF domain-containing protein [Burkholderiales bacterium]